LPSLDGQISESSVKRFLCLAGKSPSPSSGENSDRLAGFSRAPPFRSRGLSYMRDLPPNVPIVRKEHINGVEGCSG
jgi:hypothetical protein